MVFKFTLRADVKHVESLARNNQQPEPPNENDLPKIYLFSYTQLPDSCSGCRHRLKKSSPEQTRQAIPHSDAILMLTGVQRETTNTAQFKQ